MRYSIQAILINQLNLFKEQDRLEKLRQWSSDPNAYATLQPTLCYFDHPHGYLAYRRVLAGNVVLGDPIAKPGKIEELFADFLKAYPTSVFGYLSETAAAALARVGKQPIHFVRIGVERCVNLTDQAPFSGSISGALKKAGKANLQLVERDLSRISADELAQLRQINEQFISLSQSKKEIGFISRAMRFEPEPDVRFFVIQAGAEGKPIGFLVLDPWYEGSRLQGYQLHQFRLGPTKVWGVFLSVVAMLIQLLSGEGFSRLSLGGGIGRVGSDEEMIPRSWIYDYCRDATFYLIDRFHSLTNLSRNKFEFAGTDLNRYLAAPHWLPLVPLVRLARANNIF
ncbi:DUF2156 domain-containing protein [Hymenobacter sp. BT664]|uniref:DUF2156 domain-containing protein n=1 Tax=Hymenobacter montanus TaxID=2771359 RepID=A0A927GHD1_9BACT|nr:phosphatidylglycerol lysyltransferase domain-containing protein [Hymenobacter montanus]MBD2766283.1 DUF2156 domain-containing protein [Hymenobacter montanus]